MNSKIYYPGTGIEIQSYKHSQIFKQNLIILNGKEIKLDNNPIRKGDTYLAERDTGIKILIAKEIDEKNNTIVPHNSEYCYYIQECRRVAEIN